MSTIDTIPARSAHRSSGAAVTHSAMGLWADFVAWMMEAAEKRRSRDALAQLSDEQLRDIGLTRADAWREGNRSVWG